MARHTSRVASPQRPSCTIGALKRTATDPQCQRVFDIVTHKCEYLEEMAGVKQRLSAVKRGCVVRAEKAIKTLKEQQRVEFELGSGPKGPLASKITAIA